MKKSLLLLSLILLIGCSKINNLIYTWNGVDYDLTQEQIEGYNLPTTYTIAEGANHFEPQLPNIPFFRDVLEYDLTLPKEWFDSNFTNKKGYGLVLPALSGNGDYHDGGCNFVLFWDDGIWICPNYYEAGILTCLSDSRVKMQADTTIRCKIVVGYNTEFYLDNVLIASVPIEFLHSWKSAL